MAFLILIFITSFLLVLFSIPSLITIAMLKQLFDTPEEGRKLHTTSIPTIGGIAIFAGVLFSFSLWFPNEKIHDSIQLFEAVKQYKYIVLSLLVMFFVGVKDDIIGTAAIKKLIAHILVGMVLILMADIRIVTLHGLFDVFVLPYWASVFLSLFTYIVVVNAFNLIDGIDGLAAGIGFIVSTAFGLWFCFAGDFVMSALAFSLSGSLLAFLFFNFSPAKIFMGDSGSLVIGLIISILAIKLVSYDASAIQNQFLLHCSQPIFVLASLVYPLIDTLRIFIYRAVHGVSPFEADRNHLHHRFIDIGLTHKKTAIIIYLVNIFIISLTLLLSFTGFNANYNFIIIAGVSVLLAQIPFFIARKVKKLEDKNE
jgi:UDP-GlcNAc:undecaprenyl-phosphate GlcNAc-1-phosphate transferase